MVSIHSLFLPDEGRFTGEDLVAFLLDFALLLARVGIEYLADANGVEPTTEGAPITC